MDEKAHSCLITRDGEEVPLAGVRAAARLSGLCSEVTVTQRFVNRESKDVEAVYVFPLEERAAVCAFRARCGERIITGHVEEREKAFERYDDAMAQGHGAFLVDQERPNVFTLSVGNLRPSEELEIEITYVALLGFEDEAIRFTLPTTVSPRYVPPGGKEVGQPDGERVNPPRAGAVPYGISIRVEVAGAPREVASPSHPVRVELAAGGATVTLAADEVALDRDFVLLVTPARPHEPEVRIARDADGTPVAMVTFRPEVGAEGEAGREVAFVLDCSGSMQGDSIAQAKQALALCIRALGERDTFNVTCFGGTFRSLWPAPRRYDARSLDEATAFLRGIGADMGGTEILAPLTAVLDAPADPERFRQLLVLTDGEVSNEDQVIALAARHAGRARIFTFGIGAGASEHLVRGLARASHGAAEAVYPGERIEPKVLRMARRLGAPAFREVRLDWEGASVDQSPATCPPIFSGEPLTVFARIRSGRPATVTLRADGRSWQLPVDLERAEPGGAIPTLWARETVRDLEARAGAPRGSAQGDRTRDDRARRLVEIATRYGLLSSETSYVAVEERAPEARSTGAAQLRRIPVAVTMGWHGRGTVLPGRLSAGAMAPASMAAAPPPPSPAAPRPMRAMFSVTEARARSADAAPSGGSGIVLGSAPASEGMLAKLLGKAKAPSERAQAEAPPDPLYEILMTQQADGSFPMSDALRTWLGDRARAAGELAREKGEAAVATALVVALLAKEAADRRDEWEPAARKAKLWLERQGVAVEVATLLGA